MRRRVVVTGIGCVTPLGTDVETVWKRLLNGESGVGYTTLFDASNFPTKISAEVRNWDLSDVGENPADWKYQGRHTHFAVGAFARLVQDRQRGHLLREARQGRRELLVERLGAEASAHLWSASATTGEEKTNGTLVARAASAAARRSGECS